MATTSSMILNDDQANPIFAPLPVTSPHEQAQAQTQTNSLQSAATTENLISEIHAIQQAMQEEHFDFSTLEAPAAGNTDSSSNTPSNNDKSAASPILLDDAGLLINYRSNDTSSESSNKTAINFPNQENSNSTEDTSLTAINDVNIDQIQASVSEDFITAVHGKFETNQNISPQSFDTAFGTFTSDSSGNWQYVLNNQLTNVQSLSAGDSINDVINLTTPSGQKLQVAIEINGTNDQAVITGSKLGNLRATPVADLENNHPSISGKLAVSDADLGEARFQTNFDIQGSFGVAQINALGEWTYTLNNNANAIQGLRTGDKLLDVFSVKTIDGTNQLIQINIEGVNDKPLLSGQNAADLDLEFDLTTTGSVLINDPDFGESSFQSHSGIRSSLGYGAADIDSQGNWTFNLDIEYIKLNTINEGETRIDTFEVFTADGTRQELHVTIKGSNTPLYAQENDLNANTKAIAFTDLIKEQGEQDEISAALNASFGTTEAKDILETSQLDTDQTIETVIYLNSGHDLAQTLNNLPDINLS